jgi:alpha-mannosidase
VHSGVIASGWRKRLAFTADLPALGYRVYHLLAGQAPHAAQPIPAEDSALENERFRLEIDPSSGFVRRLYDKRRQFEVLRGPARPLVLRDESDTWGHGVYQFNELIGAFTATAIRRVEHGPVKTTLRVESTFGASRLIQDYTMYPDRDVIEVRVVVDWREQWRLLKLAFPLNLHFFRATYEIPYGFIERPTNGEEEPGQSWVDLSGLARGLDIPYGLSLLNDGKYSFDVGGHELRMTVLRSPIYAHHVPNMPDPDQYYPVMDQGVQQFTYALLPHDDSWEQAGTVRRALELNERPIAIAETFHAGPLPQRGSFLAIDRENIVASVLKRAEDNDDLIVRCYETQRIATCATMRMPAWGREFTADFAPCEIKTFRVPRDPNASASETDLLEWG